MSYLKQYIKDKKTSGEKLLSIYLTAGFPTIDATLPLLETIVDAGADLIELGVPFSDPLADGPTIQHASRVAIQGGITLDDIIEILAEFNSRNRVPTLLMGYTNPFLQFGWEKLAARAAEAGVSGFIIPDLPPDECHPISGMLTRKSLELIFLAAPNTPVERLRYIDRLSGAFIYAVSLTGVTGIREKLPGETQMFLKRLRQLSSHPILAGFGISGPESARRSAPFCEGVIIGSAIIQLIRESSNLQDAREDIHRFIIEVKKALRE